jgi:hypothetical protein
MSAREIKFVKTLLAEPQQRQERSLVFLVAANSTCSLPMDNVLQLRAQGVVSIKQNGQVIARPEARAWLKRKRLAKAQSEAMKNVANTATAIISANDTITRLAKVPCKAVKGEGAFLAPHHVETANRISALVQKAQIRAHITQNLDALAMPKQSGNGSAAEIGDFAMDCRNQLTALLDILPNDCARVLLDVCGFDKGLQQIEFEMQWPRRSAKLVLRMALDHAANHWRIDAVAQGRRK